MKDILILSGMALGAVAVGSVLFFYGVGTLPSSQNGSAVAASVVAQGAYAPIDTRTNYLITNESELQSLWSLIYGSGDALPAVPQVDFSKEQVMAIFAGVKPTGGYGISVSKVEDVSGKRVVTITIARPKPSCTVTQAQTAPYEIVAVPHTTLPITHTDISETRSCN